MQWRALEKSMATAGVLAGGLFSLNPSAIAVTSGRSVEVVEWEGLKHYHYHYCINNNNNIQISEKTMNL